MKKTIISLIVLLVSSIFFFIFVNPFWFIVNLLTYVIFVYFDFIYVSLSNSKPFKVLMILSKVLILYILFISYGSFINDTHLIEEIKIIIMGLWFGVFVYLELLFSFVYSIKLRLIYGRIVRILTYFPILILFYFMSANIEVYDYTDEETVKLALTGMAIIGAVTLMFEGIITTIYSAHFSESNNRTNHLTYLRRHNKFTRFKNDIINRIKKL